MYDSLNMHSLESSLIDIMRAEQDPMKGKLGFPFLYRGAWGSEGERRAPWRGGGGHGCSAGLSCWTLEERGPVTALLSGSRDPD